MKEEKSVLKARQTFFLPLALPKSPVSSPRDATRALLAVWGKAGLALSLRASRGLPRASNQATAGTTLPRRSPSILPDPA